MVKRLEKYLTRMQIITIVVPCAFTAIAWIVSVNAYDGRLDTVESAAISSAKDISEIKKDISVIRESQEWIKKALNRSRL